MGLKIYKHGIISYKILLHLEKNNEKHKQASINKGHLGVSQEEWVLFFFFSLSFKFSTKYTFYRSTISTFIDRKKMLFLKRNSILNDFETCHSASPLRLAAFLPSSFVPLNWLSEGGNPTTSLPRIITYIPLAFPFNSLIKSDNICKLRSLTFILDSSD